MCPTLLLEFYASKNSNVPFYAVNSIKASGRVVAKLRLRKRCSPAGVWIFLDFYTPPCRLYPAQIPKLTG